MTRAKRTGEAIIVIVSICAVGFRIFHLITTGNNRRLKHSEELPQISTLGLLIFEHIKGMLHVVKLGLRITVK